MGNTFGKRTLAPGFHQEAARALGTTPGKTTRVQQELGAGLGVAAADESSEDVGRGAAVPGLSGLARPAQVRLSAGSRSTHSAATT